MRKLKPSKVKCPVPATCTSSKWQRWGLNPDTLAAESKFFTTFLAVAILPISGLLGHSANLHGVSAMCQALCWALRTQQGTGQTRSLSSSDILREETHSGKVNIK